MKKLNATDGGGEFDESEHPRNEDGEFTKKGNGGVSVDKITQSIVQLSKQEYGVLRQEIFRKNASRQARGKSVGTAFTANYFYIYDSRNGGDFKVLQQIKIEGNEAKIDYWWRKFNV